MKGCPAARAASLGQGNEGRAGRQAGGVCHRQCRRAGDGTEARRARQHPQTHIICVAPASKLFSSISLRALAGLCRATGSTASGGGRPSRQWQRQRQRRHGRRRSELGSVAGKVTRLDDFPGRDAVHHRLVQQQNAGHRLGLPHGAPAGQKMNPTATQAALDRRQGLQTPRSLRPVLSVCLWAAEEG